MTTILTFSIDVFLNNDGDGTKKNDKMVNIPLNNHLI